MGLQDGTVSTDGCGLISYELVPAGINISRGEKQDADQVGEEMRARTGGRMSN